MMMKIETGTVRRFGRSLYVKLPSIMREELDPKPGEKIILSRDINDPTQFGMKLQIPGAPTE